MEGLPDIGTKVRFFDPWFYPGTGVVTRVQFRPHHAVQVKVETIDDPRNQRWVGRRAWILPGHMTVLEVNDGSSGVDETREGPA